MESYERHKKEGAVLIGIYGTPQTQALTAEADRGPDPGDLAGLRHAAAADGTKYPYIFPIAATYWSQGAAAVEFAKNQLGGSLKGKKIAYLFYDNPAGREPMPGARGPRGAWRASSSRPSRCRPRASRWAPRCSTSPSASAPTS